MRGPRDREQISEARKARAEAVVRERWGNAPTSSIGNSLNVTSDVVVAIAARLGLGPNLWEATGAVPVPDRPRGFKRAQVAWARAARTAEAVLILGMIGELQAAPRDPAAKGMGAW